MDFFAYFFACLIAAIISVVRLGLKRIRIDDHPRGLLSEGHSGDSDAPPYPVDAGAANLCG
jgi:hypothetical protein